MAISAPIVDVSRHAERLRARVYGANASARPGERMAIRMGILNVIAAVLLALAASQGLAGWAPVLVTMGYSWIGQAAFFGLMRSRWAARRADPTLSFEQLMFAISVVVLSYGTLEIARGAALELLCLLLAFGMEQLSTRELLKASFSAIVLLALTSLARILALPGRVELHVEIYNLLMAAVLLPVAIVAGAEIGRLYRRQASQREQLAATLGRLTELSVRDGLTGLTNRRHALRLLEEARSEAALSRQGCCVAMLDIDWFKRVNDGHGHAVGDSVLKEFARLLASEIASGSTLARWGGEEFLLLMPRSTLPGMLATLSACRARVAAFDWTTLAPGLQVTFSAGAASHRPGDAIETTLQRADAALYAAKSAGRNRTEVSREEDAAVPAAPPARRAALAPRAETAPPSPAAGSAKAAARPPQAFSRLGDLRGGGAREGDPAQPPKRWAWLADRVLGQAPDIRENLRLPLIAIVLHAVWLSAVWFYAMPNGQIARGPGWAVIVYESTCAAGFYAAIRCGWSRRFSDGGLVLAQMLAASAVASFGYVVAEALRPSLLHLLCVIQVFGMVTLRPAETRTAGNVAIALLVAVMAFMIVTRPPDLDAELLKLVLAGTIVLQLSLLSHGYSTVRERVNGDHLELEQAVAQVEEQVMCDPLTGLLNRRFMEQALARQHAEWLAGGDAYCLGILDIDHFKRINDQRGHHVGDAVLVALAQASRHSLRETDLMCRWGGEEFMWLLRGSAEEWVGRATMQRLRSSFMRTAADLADIDWRVTFSSGFVRPREHMTVEALILEADRALYQAKQAGRDRDVFAGDIDAAGRHAGLDTQPAAGIA
jgi:diguanylate cyclase (GGDEF)-like protein